MSRLKTLALKLQASTAMTDDQWVGYDWAFGVTRRLAELLLFGFILYCVLTVLYNMLGIGLDTSDTSGWDRSGLRVHQDALTGVEYLSDGKGGLVQRAPRPKEVNP